MPQQEWVMNRSWSEQGLSRVLSTATGQTATPIDCLPVLVCQSHCFLLGLADVLRSRTHPSWACCMVAGYEDISQGRMLTAAVCLQSKDMGCGGGLMVRLLP